MLKQIHFAHERLLRDEHLKQIAFTQYSNLHIDTYINHRNKSFIKLLSAVPPLTSVWIRCSQINFDFINFMIFFIFIIFKLKSFSQYGAILASNPVAIVKQLFIGPWDQCIIHATLQPVWRTYCSDIYEWANRSIVNHGSVMGSDWRKEAVLWGLFSLFFSASIHQSLSVPVSIW